MGCGSMKNRESFSISALFMPLVLLTNTHALAQSVLPKGVGILKGGYRHMASPERTFDANGNDVTLGDTYSRKFTGPEMLKGSYGDDLKKLATWLNKYNSSVPGGLLDRLTLGNLNIAIDTKLLITMAGAGIGINNWLTAYAGIPIIDVAVNANFSFSGLNTATQIKNELGELAPDELRDGLDQASKVSLQDVLDSFKSKGYSTQTSWKTKTIGDTRVGVYIDPYAMRNLKPENHQIALNLELSIPTGYVGKPEILVDTDLGRGYYALYGEVADKHIIAAPFFLSYVGAGAFGIPAKRNLRVPIDDSAFAEANRLAAVKVTPGIDSGFRVGGGITFSAFEPYVGACWEGHSKDSFSGNLAGNYAKLAEGTNYGLASSELGITATTLNAYKAKEFPVPIIFKILWKKPWWGFNKMNDHFIEISLTSFFPTPWMEEKAELPKPVPPAQPNTESPSILPEKTQEPSPAQPSEQNRAPRMSPEDYDPVQMPPQFNN